MNYDMGQQRLQEAEQRRAMTGGQVSGATRGEAVQEGQDVELTATHAVGNAASSKFRRVETSSRMEDVSVSMKREPEMVGSSDDGGEDPQVVGFGSGDLQSGRVVL